MTLSLAFFIKGGYLPKDKVVAEEEFKLAVENLKEKEDNDTKAWAESIISSSFRCLQTTETLAYWSSLAITSSTKEDVISTDKAKFKITTASDYKKRSAPAKVVDPPRKHIKVAMDDGIVLPGLNVSLLSHLKTIVVNKLGEFESQTDKQKYYTTATMNNVLDLSNLDNNDQLASLSATQVQALKNKFHYQDPPAYFTDPVKGIMAQKGNNMAHALKFINGRISETNTVVAVNKAMRGIRLCEE